MDSSAPLQTPPAGGDLTQDLFGRLSHILYASDDAQDIYTAIITSATTLVPGCDHASIMVRNKDGAFVTAAATDDVARHIDTLERLYREGPCVDAVVDDAPQFEPDLHEAPQWPTLAREIMAQTPVRAVAGFRIVAGDRKIGALNLFSDTVHGMDGVSSDRAIVLAAFAGVAVTALRAREQARSLASGLQSNREIGKAVGLLMAFHKVSDTQAFEILNRTSQDMNVRLAEVAHRVVEHHNAGHPDPSAAT